MLRPVPRPTGPIAMATRLAAGMLVLAATGCTTPPAGPDYVRPPVPVPARWQVEAPWRESQPDDAAPKGPWWQRFADPQLNALQQQALAGNPGMALAAARLAQARATLATVQAGLMPVVGVSNRDTRFKISADRPLASYTATNFGPVQNDLVLAMNVNYELDLAGRVRRGVEGAQASLQQSEADAENTRLVLTTDLATAYFNLRAIDTEIDVLQRALALQAKALDIVTARRDGGAASGLEVAQQQAVIETTKVQLDLLRRQRGPFEHAVATLAGVPAPDFALPPDPRPRPVPVFPLGVPSDVLERRPDVASAERAMAAANAQVGVASAAHYPSITLGLSGGLEGRAFNMLFDKAALLWSLGVTAAQTVYDGGRVKAGVALAEGAHAAAIANYRRVVLLAMQEVQDGIGGLQALERAATQARSAQAAAQRVLDLATARYEGGASGYLEVITAQQALLTAQRQVAQLDGQRVLTTVFLVKALGGDWERRGAGAGAGG